jgi:hypothetical protein
MIKKKQDLIFKNFFLGKFCGLILHDVFMDITSSNLNDQQYMNNKDLIRQYVNTGIGIPRYQFDKLSNNNKISYLKKMEVSIKYDAKNIHYYYGKLPEAIQLIVVKQDGHLIRYIDNPSPELQMAAVNQNARAIRHIDNPSPELQMAAVNKDGYAIQWIKNPSPEAIALHKKLYGE